MRHGYGRLVWSDGNTYEGGWKNDNISPGTKGLGVCLCISEYLFFFNCVVVPLFDSVRDVNLQLRVSPEDIKLCTYSMRITTYNVKFTSVHCKLVNAGKHVSARKCARCTENTLTVSNTLTIEPQLHTNTRSSHASVQSGASSKAASRMGSTLGSNNPSRDTSRTNSPRTQNAASAHVPGNSLCVYILFPPCLFNAQVLHNYCVR